MTTLSEAARRLFASDRASDGPQRRPSLLVGTAIHRASSSTSGASITLRTFLHEKKCLEDKDERTFLRFCNKFVDTPVF